jgi:hypothetical protein
MDKRAPTQGEQVKRSELNALDVDFGVINIRNSAAEVNTERMGATQVSVMVPLGSIAKLPESLDSG